MDIYERRAIELISDHTNARLEIVLFNVALVLAMQAGESEDVLDGIGRSIREAENNRDRIWEEMRIL